MADFNLADLWELLADAGGDTEVLVAGDQRRTYKELDARANRLAHHLAESGVGPGDHIGLYSFNRVEFVEALLAAWKIRAVPVNINYRYVEAELAYLLGDADLVAMVYERGYADRLSALAADFPGLKTYVSIADDQPAVPDVPGAVDYEEALAAASPERGFGPRSADDRYVVYTGGTTGMPKGTMWRHEDIFFGAMGGGGWPGTPIATPEAIAGNAVRDFRLTFMPAAPLMHGAAQWFAVGGLLAGNRVVLYTARKYDAADLLSIAEREQVSSIQIVGDAMGRPLADAARRGRSEATSNMGGGGRRVGSYDLSKLYVVGSGGAVLSEAVKDELRAVVPHLMINDSYGSSELGAGGSGVPKKDADKDDAAGNAPRFAMGPQITVLDQETMRPVEPGSGVVGRIARTGHIPLGYWKDEVKTAATFPTVDGVRYVVPGDFGMIEADGTIVMLGRGSVCINSGGEKIYPEEVESALKAHPDVFDCIVVGVPDERWGARVVGVVQPREGTAPTYDDLAAHSRTLLAGYKVPRAVVLVDEIGRTNVGKADYAWASRVAAQGS
ncbi:acyl-CoA synthetase [Yinghuangia seranimata]|uniref:acyl-CoA synthetase n=1 Tax=Yinghuangia seranimata TaxID=408067 RepID=UPI00248ABAA0|nr:acyl-CoA synthetase [Yinghuangia seranimata]MDI2130241.1 acyl-CoA synthetase [Yinghuangia seranimata]